jgi:hypothetical protein
MNTGGVAVNLPTGLAGPGALRRDPPRWVAALALVGALAVTVTPVADWLEVAPGEAARHGEALREAARAEAKGPDARLDAWADLGKRLAERNALSGLDLVRWSAAARAQLAEADRRAGAESPVNTRTARAWQVLAVAIVAVAAAGALLAFYLAASRLRRFRTPMRVLAGTSGTLALALAAGLDWFCRPAAGALFPGVAQGALLAGGAGLVGALVASLTWRSVLPVLLATAATIAALAAVAALWVGVVPA